MIQYTDVSIFKLPVMAYVNPINCKGAMGKGLALDFKKLFPLNFSYYKKQCTARNVKPGTMLVYKTMLVKRSPNFIINFPTKDDWKNPSELQFIADGLKHLVQVCIEENITSIAIPQLGCGLGGLDWEVVRPMIIEAFINQPQITVFLWR